MITAINSLLLVSFISFLISYKDKRFTFILLLSQIIIYIFIISLSSIDTYSDRSQYIYWFNNLDLIMAEHNDTIFISYMKILHFFSNSKIWFFFMYGFTIIAILGYVSKNYLSNNFKVGVFFLLLIPNRYFLEYSMNSMRAFFLIVVYLGLLYLIIYKKKYLIFIFIPFLFFVHKGIFVATTIIILGYLFVQRINFTILFMGISLLYVFGVQMYIFDSLEENYLSFYFNEFRAGSATMFLETNIRYHLIGRISLFLFILVPSWILIFKIKLMNNLDKSIFNFTLLASSFLMISSFTVPILLRVFGLILILNYLLFAKYYDKNSRIDLSYTILSLVSSFIIYQRYYLGLI